MLMLVSLALHAFLSKQEVLSQLTEGGISITQELIDCLNIRGSGNIFEQARWWNAIHNFKWCHFSRRVNKCVVA